MRTVWAGGKPAGRRSPSCKFLAYSVRMDPRRKIVGQRIKAARRAAGYKSARAFARAVRLSESSIANAERGADSVGSGVYLDIETGLGWPTGTIARYLDTGEPDDLPPVKPATATPAEPDLLDPQDDMERQIVESSLSKREKRRLVASYRDALEEERRVLRPTTEMHSSGLTPRNSSDT